MFWNKCTWCTNLNNSKGIEITWDTFAYNQILLIEISHSHRGHIHFNIFHNYIKLRQIVIYWKTSCAFHVQKDLVGHTHKMVQYLSNEEYVLHRNICFYKNKQGNTVWCCHCTATHGWNVACYHERQFFQIIVASVKRLNLGSWTVSWSLIVRSLLWKYNINNV